MRFQPSTAAGHDSHTRNYIRHCSRSGELFHDPISAERLQRIVSWWLSDRQITGLKNFIPVLDRINQANGHGKLDLQNADWLAFLAGARNLFGLTDEPKPKKGIRLQHLQRIRSYLDLQQPKQAMLWCMALFAYFGLLRAGELVSLQLQDVCELPLGLQLRVALSKTNLRPAFVNLAAREDMLCPVLAFKVFRSLCPSNTTYLFTAAASSEGPHMSQATWAKHIKSWVIAMGLNPDDFAGHSFRRGGFTDLTLAGTLPIAASRHGRWADSSLVRFQYYDHADDAAWIPTLTLAMATIPNFSPAALSNLPDTLIQRCRVGSRPLERP